MQQLLRRAVLICTSIVTIFVLAGLHFRAAGAEQVSQPASTSDFQLGSVLGREVRTSDDDSGRVIDLLTDTEGQLRAAVIEFGGFLGLGTRKIAVEWEALRFIRDGGRLAIVVDVTRDQLRAAPEYKPNEPPVVVKALAN